MTLGIYLGPGPQGRLGLFFTLPIPSLARHLRVGFFCPPACTGEGTEAQSISATTPDPWCGVVEGASTQVYQQRWAVSISGKDQAWPHQACCLDSDTTPHLPNLSNPPRVIPLSFPQESGSVIGLPDAALSPSPNLGVTGPRAQEGVRTRVSNSPCSAEHCHHCHPASLPACGPYVSSVLCTDRY